MRYHVRHLVIFLCVWCIFKSMWYTPQNKLVCTYVHRVKYSDYIISVYNEWRLGNVNGPTNNEVITAIEVTDSDLFLLLMGYKCIHRHLQACAVFGNTDHWSPTTLWLADESIYLVRLVHWVQIPPTFPSQLPVNCYKHLKLFPRNISTDRK